MASPIIPVGPVTLEEYLAFEESSPEKHEYVGGYIYRLTGVSAMSGASRRHHVSTRRCPRGQPSRSATCSRTRAESLTGRVAASFHAGNYTAAEFVAPLAPLPLDFAPGERFAHTNSGAPLLGIAIQKVSGMQFERFVTEQAADTRRAQRNPFQA